MDELASLELFENYSFILSGIKNKTQLYIERELNIFYNKIKIRFLHTVQILFLLLLTVSPIVVDYFKLRGKIGKVKPNLKGFITFIDCYR